MKKSLQLKNRLKKKDLLVAPGASTALLAKMVELSGFEVVYATGAGCANMIYGVPDIGLVSSTQIIENAKRLNDAISLPLIVDIDNGYGNALNVYHTVRECSQNGFAALQLEDQSLPKRCGHFNGKSIISKEEMIGKIKAAKDASLDDDMLLIARTDAIAIGGLSEAMDRAGAYLEAGADILFVEAPTNREDMAKITQNIKAVHIANMVEGGKTPILSNQELSELGFNIALYANAPLKAAIYGTLALLDRLKETGTTNDCEDVMISMKMRNEITELAKFMELEKKYS